MPIKRPHTQTPQKDEKPNIEKQQSYKLNQLKLSILWKIDP
jgi:hypothetical protein